MEIGVAIIIACLPVCRVVIEHLLPANFLPNSRRYIRTKDKNRSYSLRSVERPLRSGEQQARDVYSVPDGDVPAVQLKVPEAAAAPMTTDEMAVGMQQSSPKLQYTAEANRASSEDVAALDGNGRRISDVEAGKSIAVKHDVVVTRQER